MSEALIVFKAINSDADKNNLLQRLMNSGELLILRDKFDRTITLKPMGLNDKLDLKCHPPEAAIMSTESSTTFTASFTINDERYLFETVPAVSPHSVTLTVLNLFHLQRRRYYRYTIPTDYSGELVITQLNRTACSHRCRLLDLSTEGCAVEIHQAEAGLSLEDVVEAEILLGNREPIAIQGHIKNIRVKEGEYLTLGVKFNHLANGTEGKIVTSLTDLQREIHFRKSS